MMDSLPPQQPTVVCVLRSGEFRGRIYTPKWVRCLKAMVKRNLSMEHRFVCFTDLDEIPGVEVLPLKYRLPGWWSKIELFSWNAGCRLLYLDLDVLVTGQLEPLFNYPGPLVLAPAIITKPKPKMVRKYQSSVMVWTPPAGRDIFYKFTSRAIERYHGDQDYIGDMEPDCATFPAKWFCKLGQCKNGPPPDVKVVLCQHPVTPAHAASWHPWVREIWREDEEGVASLPEARQSDLERNCP